MRFDLKGSSARRAAGIVVLAVWAALTVFGSFHHEQFRDEADKWLVARDAVSVREFFEFQPLQRAPAGWYLLLMPFAKLGAPFWVSKVIAWLFAFGAACLLWFRAPLPWPVRLTALFSYFLLYDVPLIARNYSMMTCLAFLAMAAYPARWEHPYRFVLVLLALMNTNYAALNIACALGLIFLVECLQRRVPRRRTFFLAALLGLGVLGFFAQTFTGGAPGLQETQHAQTVADFLYVLKRSFAWMETWHLVGLLLLWGLFFLGLLLRPRALLLAVWSMAPSAYLLWKGLIARQFLTSLLVGTLITAWQVATEPEHPWRSAFLRTAAGKLALLRRAVIWLLAVPFAASVWFGVAEIAKEYRMRFSDGTAAAAFIKANGLEDMRIMVFPDGNGLTLLPYLPGKQIFYIGAGRWGTKNVGDKYNEFGQFTSYQTAVNRAFKYATGNRDFLLVLNREYPVPGTCRMIYKSDFSQVIWDEYYVIYRCGPRAAAAPR